MKPLVCLIALAFFATVHADPASTQRTPLDGFLGIPWGATEDTAKTQLASRAHAQFNPKESTDSQLRFDGGEFAGFKVHHFVFNFVAGGFCTAEVTLAPTTKTHRKEFLAFRQMLTEKFGPPGRDQQDPDNLEATWYFPIPKNPANLINLVQSSDGPGLRIAYNSESTKTARKNLPEPPLKIPPGAKNDL